MTCTSWSVEEELKRVYGADATFKPVTVKIVGSEIKENEDPLGDELVITTKPNWHRHLRISPIEYVSLLPKKYNNLHNSLFCLEWPIGQPILTAVYCRVPFEEGSFVPRVSELSFHRLYLNYFVCVTKNGVRRFYDQNLLLPTQWRRLHVHRLMCMALGKADEQLLISPAHVLGQIEDTKNDPVNYQSLVEEMWPYLTLMMDKGIEVTLEEMLAALVKLLNNLPATVDRATMVAKYNKLLADYSQVDKTEGRELILARYRTAFAA